MRTGITHNIRADGGAIQTWIGEGLSPIVLDLNGAIEFPLSPDTALRLSRVDAKAVVAVLLSALDELDRSA